MDVARATRSRMRMSSTTFAASEGCGQLTVEEEPSPDPDPTPGCSSDAECSGDQVCENGNCVSPDPTNPGDGGDNNWMYLLLLAIAAGGYVFVR